MDEKTIDALCKKFHTTIDYLIPTYSHYMVNKNIAIIIIYLIIILISAFFIYRVGKKTKQEYNSDILNWSIFDIIIVVTGSVVLIISLIWLLYSVYDLTLWITSPEMRFFDMIVSSN